MVRSGPVVATRFHQREFQDVRPAGNTDQQDQLQDLDCNQLFHERLLCKHRRSGPDAKANCIKYVLKAPFKNMVTVTKSGSNGLFCHDRLMPGFSRVESAAFKRAPGFHNREPGFSQQPFQIGVRVHVLRQALPEYR